MDRRRILTAIRNITCLVAPLPPGAWPGGRGRGWVARSQGRNIADFLRIDEVLP